MKWLSLIFLSLICSCSLVFADAITVNNLTEEDLWMATYYHTKKKNERVSEVVKIDNQSSRTMQRPKRKLWHDRELAFTYHKDILKPWLGPNRWQDIMSKNIGYTKGNTFHIVKEDGSLKAYNNFEWNYTLPLWQAFQEIFNTLKDPLQDLIKQEHPAVKENPYHDRVAQVRVGNELPQIEKEYLEIRKPKVKKTLEKILAQSIDDDKVPTIAFVASGGGYRAMMCTVGSMLAADDLNLCDVATYISTLSGSTWAVGSWYATGLPIHRFKENMIEKVTKKIYDLSAHEIELMVEALIVKVAFEQPLSLIDLYGLLLANTFFSDFGDKRHQVYLSQQVERIRFGDWMFPIYTAIRAEEDVGSQWYEFTPLEVGGSWLARYVPAWAFGRRFINGKSVDFAPEQSFGFHMGIFGSAFAATVGEIYETIKHKISPVLVQKLIEKMLHENDFHDDRLTCAQVNNFALGMRKPITELDIMSMADAGSHPGFNLPYPPISPERPERKADIIIFLDYSSNVKDGLTIKQVERYARDRRFNFPPINYGETDQKVISVFKDEYDSQAPVVIYMPLYNDSNLWSKLDEPEYASFAKYIRNFDVQHCIDYGHCNTFDLEYADFEVRQLCKLCEFNMLVSKDEIINAIRWKIDHMP